MPRALALLVVLCLYSAHAMVSEIEAVQLFTDFKMKFGKVYSSTAEEVQRFTVFKANLDEIDQLNADNPYAVFGVTKFADQSDSEFAGTILSNMTGQDEPSVYNETIPVDGNGLPLNFDWRNSGILTPVKNQMQCGSCWAHAAAEAVESYWAKKTGKLVEVSVQQIVDCNRLLGNSGCNGGFPGPALTYAKNSGLVPASLYPYQGKTGTCKLHYASQVVATVGGWNHVLPNEEHMRSVLYKYSPMPVCVDATIWKYYQKGIITGQCTRHVSPNHAVVLVGWGTEQGIPYWTIRNSWDRDWGEQGYIRIQRGTNKCNILSRPYVPCSCNWCQKC